MEVRIQSVVVEFILNHVDVLFSGKINVVMQEGAGMAQGFVYYQEHGSKLPKDWKHYICHSVNEI
jgi:hypothetical protein